MYPREVLTAVNQLCRNHGCYHICDEAYEYFTYDDYEHFSPGSLASSAEHTLSLYSLSKAYGMAGWRCGYMVVPAHLSLAIRKIQDTNLICPSLASQLAALAALSAGAQWAQARIAPLGEVRAMVIEEMSQLGARCRIPRLQGAFYALAKVETAARDLDLVQALIRDWGVAVLPGSTFGMVSGCYLRIAFGSLAPATVAEGLGRLRRGLEQLL